MLNLINNITLSLAPYGGINTVMCIIIAMVVLCVGSYLAICESGKEN
jgi:hypothetical protein